MKYWSKDGAYNPFVGCEHISDGCDNCYAAACASQRRMAKYERVLYNGKWTGDLHLDRTALESPLHMRKPQVFFNSMCDPFHKLVPYRWIQDMMKTIIMAKQHTFVICTKRAERMYDQIKTYCHDQFPNLYLGVTVENQECADERLPHLAKLAAAGWNTWISYEPALAPIDWSKHLRIDLGSIGEGFHQYALAGFKGIICGGESGPNARPAHPDWFRSCRDACAEAGVKFALKQLGGKTTGHKPPLLDGIEHWQLPWEEKK